MLSEWNKFVKKVYEEGKAKDANYKFKQALVDASKRKSEMGHMSTAKNQSKKRKSRTAAASGGKRKSRRHRKH